MGDTLRWVPREEGDNNWNINCQYLRQHGWGNLGVVWYSLLDYDDARVKYKKNRWYYADMRDGEAHEAANQEEAKALCIMLCKLNQ